MTQRTLGASHDPPSTLPHARCQASRVPPGSQAQEGKGMNRKHSVSPWYVDHTYDGTYIRAAHSGKVAYVATLESGSQAMRDADAALIAAAPELLAALEAMLHAYGIDGTGTDRKHAHQKACGAIKRARGES